MRALEPLGVEVQEARNGQEALDLLRDGLPHVVLTDLHMPLMDGLELTRRIKALDPLLPVILLTADGDKEVRLKGIEAGADDFLNRPVDLAELRLRVRGHLERRRLQEKLEDLERTLLALVRAVEAKDAYTAGHGERVAQYALWTAEELGARNGELEELRMGALLHDVGKIAIPDHILRGDYP
ncbi:MAG: response regulator, partial [Thermus caldifontis]